jgi:hypothetical protein
MALLDNDPPDGDPFPTTAGELNTTIINVIQGNGVLRLMGGVDRAPLALEALFELEMNGDEHFAAGATGWILSVDSAVSGTQVYTLYLAGVSVGTATITTGNTDATWSVASNINPSHGQRFKLEAPAAPETGKKPSFLILGTRST